MSRTNKLSKKSKEKKSIAYLKFKSNGETRRDSRERKNEKYVCVERKGRPGVLSDDWDAPDGLIDLYEYMISHENEAA